MNYLDPISIASNGFVSNFETNSLNIAMNGFLVSVEVISIPRKTGGSSHYYDPKTGSYRPLYLVEKSIETDDDKIKHIGDVIEKKVIKVTAIMGDKKLTKVVNIKDKKVNINNIKIDIVNNNIKIKIIK